MGNEAWKEASLGEEEEHEDDQQEESMSVESGLVVDGTVDYNVEHFKKELEDVLDALESSSGAKAHCCVPKAKERKKRQKLCKKKRKHPKVSCPSQASSSNSKNAKKE